MNIKSYQYLNFPFFLEVSESRIVHSEGLHEGISESISQTNPETGQELLTVHGATQGESSDAVSIHTASTSASGNGKSSILIFILFFIIIKKNLIAF